MKPPEDIKKYFQKATLSTNPDKHEAVFEKILSAREQANKNEPASSRINLGRIIMKSPISKIAIAAVVIIVFITGLTLFDKTSEVVLANVLTNIEKIGSYKYETNMTTSSSRAVGNTTININQVIDGNDIWSEEYGMKSTMKTLNLDNQETALQETYLLLKEKIMIIIMHAQKRYTRMEIDDTYVERIKNQNYNPGKMVEQFLTSEYKSLGISTIDGIRVEGFQTNDPNFAGGMFDKADIKVWVNTKTQLPVLMNIDVQTKEPLKITISGVINNFQWNVPVSEAEFEPKIPDDYTSLTPGPVKLPAINEETLIKGLKLYADLFGSYPKELNPITTSQMSKIKDSNTPAARQLQEESKKLSLEEWGQKLNDTMMPITGAIIFYMQLVQDQKDPAYYGETVTPQDFDQVLMRWKVSDNEYRVIFGNLEAMTVTNEVLAELEKTLPK